jgi:hypothetical protein
MANSVSSSSTNIVSNNPNYIVECDIVNVKVDKIVPGVNFMLDGNQVKTTYINSTTASFVAPAPGPHFLNGFSFIVNPKPSFISIFPTNPLPNTLVRLYGKGFTSDINIVLDGQIINAVFVASNEFQFISPSSAGKHIVQGIPFTVVTSQFLRIVNSVISSGDVVIVEGLNFISSTVLTLDGIEIATQYISPSRLSFIAPENGTHNVNGLFFTVTLAPIFNSVSSSNVFSGNTVIVNGANFTPNIFLSVDGRLVPTVYISSTQLSFIASQAAGNHLVNGLSFSIVAVPTYISISALDGGDIYAGNTVSFKGTSFYIGLSILLNGLEVASEFLGSNEITFIAPSAGSYTTNGGLSFTVRQRPVFTSLAPSTVFQNQLVTVTGQNFSSTMRVRLVNTTNSSALASTLINFNYINFTSISFVAGLPGNYTFEGLPLTVLEGSFITSLSSSSVFPGQIVTIFGTNFNPSLSFTLGGNPLAVNYISSTSVTFIAPNIIGSFNIAIYSGSLSINILASPIFSSISPSLIYPGNLVTVTGSNFLNTTTLVLDNANVSTTFINSTTLRFTAPAVGNHNVNGLPFTVSTPITYLSVSPAAIYFGDIVTVTGTGFISTTQLVVDNLNVATTFVNSTTLRFTAPVSGNHNVNGLGFTVLRTPVFESIFPCRVHPSEIVTVTGFDFSSSLVLLVDGSPVPVTYLNSFEVMFQAPTSIGAHNVNGLAFTVLQSTYTSISPLIASAGQVMTVTGTNFYAGTQINLDGTNIAATFVNNTTVSFISPNTSGSHNASGLIFSVVSNKVNTIVPAIAGLNQLISLTGTQLNTITSARFTNRNNSAVSLTILAANFNSRTATNITVTPVFTQQADYNVFLTGAAGEFLAGTYTYAEAAIITSIVPLSNSSVGSENTRYRITGSNFRLSTQGIYPTVTVQGSSAYIISLTSTEIIIVLPDISSFNNDPGSVQDFNVLYTPAPEPNIVVSNNPVIKMLAGADWNSLTNTASVLSEIVLLGDNLKNCTQFRTGNIVLEVDNLGTIAPTVYFPNTPGIYALTGIYPTGTTSPVTINVNAYSTLPYPALTLADIIFDGEGNNGRSRAQPSVENNYYPAGLGSNISFKFYIGPITPNVQTAIAGRGPQTAGSTYNQITQHSFPRYESRDTRVECGPATTQYFSISQQRWIKIEDFNLRGAAFSENFVDNVAVASDQFAYPDGTYSFRAGTNSRGAAGTLQATTVQYAGPGTDQKVGYLMHGFDFRWTLNYADVECILVNQPMRAVGPGANSLIPPYIANVGLDSWASTNSSFDNFATHGGLGGGRYKTVTADWQQFTCFVGPISRINTHPPIGFAVAAAPTVTGFSGGNWNSVSSTGSILTELTVLGSNLTSITNFRLGSNTGTILAADDLGTNAPKVFLPNTAGAQNIIVEYI